jgi:hypothetical protein
MPYGPKVRRANVTLGDPQHPPCVQEFRQGASRDEIGQNGGALEESSDKGGGRKEGVVRAEFSASARVEGCVGFKKQNELCAAGVMIERGGEVAPRNGEAEAGVEEGYGAG